MITNFEGITSPLTEDEMKIIPYLVDGLKRRSKANPIKRLHNPYFAEIQEDMANEEAELACLRKLIEIVKTSK